jgi:hypothetical protein
LQSGDGSAGMIRSTSRKRLSPIDITASQAPSLDIIDVARYRLRGCGEGFVVLAIPFVRLFEAFPFFARQNTTTAIAAPIRRRIARALIEISEALKCQYDLI